MFGLFKRRSEPCQLVYVVASRHAFRKWVETQPAGARYHNIHNEACARGLVHTHPPARFVVLPGADYHALLYLHTSGFRVDNPRANQPAAEQSPEWKEKIDLEYQARLAEPPDSVLREKLRKWHWAQYFKYAAEGNTEKSEYHRSLAKSVESKNKGQMNVYNIARKEREEDLKILELLDTLPCAEQKS